MKLFKTSLLLVVGLVSTFGCKPKQSVSAEPTSNMTVTIRDTLSEKPANVKKDTAFSLVSVDRTKKTIYRGLKNPLTIIVPNAVSTRVEGNGVMKVDDFGHYRITPGLGTKAEIKITATMRDGSVFTESQVFNIRNVPSPQAGLLGTKLSPGMSQATVTEDELRRAEVWLMMTDFDYDLHFEVTGFEVLFPNGKNVKIEGSKFDQKALELLKKVRHNASLQIHNFRTAPWPYDGVLLTHINPVFVKVNKKARPQK